MQHYDYTGQIVENRYKILQLLGKGGMGSVYLSEHIAIGKKVAVKFLHTEYATNSEILKRFHREAQAAATISHRNIIDVSDVGLSPQKEPYLVMEYLEGESLASMLKRTGPITLPAACGILEQVLAALDIVHQKGIIHRDLKPENIFLAHIPNEPPMVKLIDFGISKFTDPNHSNMTGTGMFIGTPAYTSPEQIRGEKDVDHLTDVYAIGVILYEMLTGKRPFYGEHHNALLISVLTDEPIPPKEAYSEFPEEVEPLIARLLRKNPAGRPQSASALLQEIRTLRNYEERHSQLLEFSSGVIDKSFAAGDLGPSVPNTAASDDASNMLAEFSAQPVSESAGTPAGWAGTEVDVKSFRNHTKVIMVTLLIAAVAIIAFFVYRSDKENVHVVPLNAQSESIPPLAIENPKNPKIVKIQINGAPKESKIIFGGLPMSRRVFHVELSPLAKKLEVTAPGYKPYHLGVVPDKDQKIEVNLKRLKRKAEKETKPKKVPPTSSSSKNDKKFFNIAETISVLKKNSGSTKNKKATQTASAKPNNSSVADKTNNKKNKKAKTKQPVKNSRPTVETSKDNGKENSSEIKRVRKFKLTESFDD